MEMIDADDSANEKRRCGVGLTAHEVAFSPNLKTFYLVDAGMGRSFTHKGDRFFYAASWAHELGFDSAIGEVAYPSRQAEFSRPTSR